MDYRHLRSTKSDYSRRNERHKVSIADIFLGILAFIGIYVFMVLFFIAFPVV